MLFSGTSYLGIDESPVFRQYLLEGFERYGNHYGGSRLSPLAPAIYEEVENHIANWLQQEAALLMSSGTLSGQLLIQYFDNEGYDFYYSPNSHVAARSHLNGKKIETWTAWQNNIQALAQSSASKFVLVSNSIDPLYLRPTPLHWISTLPSHKTWVVLIDESHSLGVLGQDGRGLLHQIDCPPHVHLLMMSSLAKAYAVPCGLISGSKKIIDTLRSTSLYGGATPSSPAFLYAFLKSQNLYLDALHSLQKNIDYFQSNLSPHLITNQLTDYPVFYFDNDNLAKYLIHQKIRISSFPYPTAQSPFIHRIILRADHTRQDIDDLLNTLNGFSKINP